GVSVDNKNTPLRKDEGLASCNVRVPLLFPLRLLQLLLMLVVIETRCASGCFRAKSKQWKQWKHQGAGTKAQNIQNTTSQFQRANILKRNQTKAVVRLGSASGPHREP